MLPKKKRLTTAMFDQVFKTGKIVHGRSLWMRSFVLPAGLPSRFAVAVPKKVASTAVLRNKIKRLVYKIIGGLNTDVLADQPNQMIIFGVKSDISKKPFTETEQEIKELWLKKAQK